MMIYLNACFGKNNKPHRLIAVSSPVVVWMPGYDEAKVEVSMLKHGMFVGDEVGA